MAKTCGLRVGSALSPAVKRPKEGQSNPASARTLGNLVVTYARRGLHLLPCSIFHKTGTGDPFWGSGSCAVRNKAGRFPRLFVDGAVIGMEELTWEWSEKSLSESDDADEDDEDDDHTLSRRCPDSEFPASVSGCEICSIVESSPADQNKGRFNRVELGNEMSFADVAPVIALFSVLIMGTHIIWWKN